MAHSKLSISDRLKSEYKHWASHCLGIKVLIQNAFYRKVIIKVKISIIYIPGETEVWYIFVTIKSELTCSMLTFWFLSSRTKLHFFPPCIIEFRLRNISKWSDSLDLKTSPKFSQHLYQCFITKCLLGKSVHSVAPVYLPTFSLLLVFSSQKELTTQ